LAGLNQGRPWSRAKTASKEPAAEHAHQLLDRRARLGQPHLDRFPQAVQSVFAFRQADFDQAFADRLA
jgi:hypothetical protein